MPKFPWREKSDVLWKLVLYKGKDFTAELDNDQVIKKEIL